MTSEQPAAAVRTEPYRGYSSAAEHIADELKRLDLLLYHQILLGGQAVQDGSMPAFRGLVVTDEEVKGLLLQHQPPDTLSRKAGHLLADIKALDEAIQQKCAAALQAGIHLPLARLAGIFRLGPLELRCVLICLAREIDSKYERLYAYLQNDITRKKPTVDLALNLLCPAAEERLAARRIFEPGMPLPTCLVHLHKSDAYGDLSLLNASMILDERIISFLLGDNGMDTRIRRWCRLFRPGAAGPRAAVLAAEEIDALKDFCRFIPGEAAGRRAPQAVYLYGPTGAGRSCRVEVIGESLQAPVLFMDVQLALSAGKPLEEVLRLVLREAILQQALLCFENFDALLEQPESRASNVRIFEEEVVAASMLVFLTGGGAAKNNVFSERCRYASVAITMPDFNARKSLWAELAREYTIEAGVDLDELAARFRFTPGQIKNTLAAAGAAARLRSPLQPAVSLDDLYAACRREGEQQLGALARKRTPLFGWSDLILPVEKLAQLQDICHRARHEDRVYREWGFDSKVRKRGLSVLLTGPPGSGKTMAAEILAGDLKLDLYMIDLSQVVDKYIGETEKNLARIFQAAEECQAILFFDEADALFGKRSEVKDAHDRNANIETAYLLQKMEEYQGISILATNLSGNMDEAFSRRLDAVVDFTEPDAALRLRIWESHFPKQAPRDPDIDLPFLAGRFKINGGTIRNIVLAAAFQAARQGQSIAMGHLVRATRQELQKMGRFCARDEFGEYGQLL